MKTENEDKCDDTVCIIPCCAICDVHWVIFKSDLARFPFWARVRRTE